MQLLEGQGMGTNDPGSHLDGLVLSDTDVVWLRLPHGVFAQHPLADVMISTDCLSHQARLTPYASDS